MDALLVIATVVFGLLFGSFINVIIYRVPRRESVVIPSSHCPHCNHDLAIKDNIPIISYLLLRGKCRYCGKPVSPRYPIVEAAASIIAVVSLFTYGFNFNFFLASFFLLVLLAVSVIDIDHKIIPNVIIIPAIIVSAVALLAVGFFGVLGVALVDRADLLSPIVGFLIGGGLLFLLAVIWPSGMGGGDVKLAAFMGLFLGRYVIIALFLGFLLGSVGGIISMAVLKKSRKDQIPFGPYLAAASVLTMYIGLPFAEWYLGISGF